MTYAYHDMKKGDKFYYPVGFEDVPKEWIVTRASNRSQPMTVYRGGTGSHPVSLEEDTWNRTVTDGVIVTYGQILTAVGEECMFEHELAGTVTSLLAEMKNDKF